MKTGHYIFRAAWTVLLLMVPAVSLTAAPKWPEIDPAELAETHGRVDPEAGAEVLLYDVLVDHMDYYSPREEHYQRVKIYDQRGVERYSKVEIPYRAGEKITNVEARTIKPDGTIVELTKAELFDRQVAKVGSFRIKQTAFAPPGLEPGVILEYRYTKRPVPGYLSTWITLQQESPVRIARGEIQTLPTSNYHVEGIFFRSVGNSEMKEGGRKGTYTFEQVNLPAKKSEPLSPSDVQTATSILLYYRENEGKVSKDFWTKTGKDLYKEGKKVTKSAREVTNTASSVVAPGDSPEQKLHKLYDFCRTKIANRDLDTVTYTAAERKRLSSNWSPSDTLKHGSGDAEDINLLFAALAATTGLETRLAVVNDRSILFVTPEHASPATMKHKVAAVRLDGAWKFFDPGAVYEPFGELAWENTDTCYILGNSSGGEVRELEGPPSSFSVQRRLADLTLSPDGTLEGNVRMDFTGLWDVDMKNDFDDQSPDDRLVSWKEEIQGVEPRAEVSSVRFENADDPIKPLRITYHIRVPGYAERTGSRLFVQSGVFQRGVPPLFKDPTRMSDILFHYRSTEEDTVLIALPEGFEIEAGSAPQSQKLGALGEYSVALGTIKDGRVLAYKRSLRIDLIALSAKQYDLIRSAFEFIHAQDNHLVTLKRTAPGQAAAN